MYELRANGSDYDLYNDEEYVASIVKLGTIKWTYVFPGSAAAAPVDTLKFAYELAVARAEGIEVLNGRQL